MGRHDEALVGEALAPFASSGDRTKFGFELDPTDGQRGLTVGPEVHQADDRGGSLNAGRVEAIDPTTSNVWPNVPIEDVAGTGEGCDSRRAR